MVHPAPTGIVEISESTGWTGFEPPNLSVLRALADAKLEPVVSMSFPLSPYLEQEDGALRIKGTRVGIEPIVVRFQEGASPEKIVDSFPTVTLAQVYGAIAYYLDNKQLIDEYMAESQRVLEKIPRLSETDPELYARLEAARRQMSSKRVWSSAFSRTRISTDISLPVCAHASPLLISSM